MMIFQALLAAALILLLVVALMNRKKEKKEWVKEERDEERGKYWENDEQGWTSPKEQARMQERKEAYQNTTAEMMKKRVMDFLYEQHPDLADLDSAGFKQLNTIIEQHANALLKDIDALRKRK
jgi:flagellar biosynthesis/type III secretory pathway M-ring protein FliF/YscJ